MYFVWLQAQTKVTFRPSPNFAGSLLLEFKQINQFYPP